MQKLVVVLLGLLFLAPENVHAKKSGAGTGVLLQDPDPSTYAPAIRLSKSLKLYAAQQWGVTMGRFATRPPTGSYVSRYRLLAQDRVRLAPSYVQADALVDGYRAPDKTTLLGYAGKDIASVTYNAFDDEEIPPEFKTLNRADQIIQNFHEGFHNHEGETQRPYAIRESFADAFSFAAARLVAEEHFRDKVLVEEVRQSVSTSLKRYRTLQGCYDELGQLYGSSLSREEKLERRKPILARCSRKTGEEVNNATLAFDATYFRNLWYALSRIHRYGIRRFVRAYTATPATEKTTEKAFLAEFEKRLRKEK